MKCRTYYLNSGPFSKKDLTAPPRTSRSSFKISQKEGKLNMAILPLFGPTVNLAYAIAGLEPNSLILSFQVYGGTK